MKRIDIGGQGFYAEEEVLSLVTKIKYALIKDFKHADEVGVKPFILVSASVVDAPKSCIVDPEDYLNRLSYKLKEPLLAWNKNT